MGDPGAGPAGRHVADIADLETRAKLGLRLQTRWSEIRGVRSPLRGGEVKAEWSGNN